MQSIAAVALSAVALLIAAAQAGARATGVPGCLTLIQARQALQAPLAGQSAGDSVDDPATCTYYPIYRPGDVPDPALLVISIYRSGLPGWKAMARSACVLDNDACPYARHLTVERDPVRYMRLLHGALVKSGNGVVGTLDGLLPGSTPAFFWNPENSEHEGTYVLIYVARQKRFVSLVCSRASEHANPHGWFEECALTAARLVYINLTI